MSNINCVVVTPESTALQREAQFVAIPLPDGEKGIAPGHAPMIGQLGSGELRLRTGSETLRYFVDEGFVQVADNVVSLMTNRVIPAADLHGSELREQLRQAQSRPARNTDQLDARDYAIHQLRAQIRVAEPRSTSQGNHS
jgi:F-type H+-transporting ATPase subunit epsilon